MASRSLRRAGKEGKTRSRGDVSVASGVTDVSLSLSDDDAGGDGAHRQRGDALHHHDDDDHDDDEHHALFARRTEALDAPHVTALAAASDFAASQFGRLDVARVWEKSALSITLTLGDETVAAQAAFADFPNVDAVKQVHALTAVDADVGR